MLTILPDQITETSAPASEPVTTAEAKSHLRVDISDDDSQIAAMVTAAREYVELYTGQSYVERTYRADLADFADDIVLPNGPVLEISSVKYYDTASPSVQQTWAAGNYQLFYNTLKRTYSTAFPAVYPRPDSVQITYTAGWKDQASPRVANIPQAIKSSILLLVAGMYENRESEVLYPGQLLANPMVKTLLNPYRVYK